MVCDLALEKFVKTVLAVIEVSPHELDHEQGHAISEEPQSVLGLAGLIDFGAWPT